MRCVVGSVDEIPPGTRKIVTVEGKSIGVFNIDGEFFALRNKCPHQGGPLCRGELLGHIDADGPGEYRYDRADRMLRCPWHGWEFDIQTGQSWFNPARTRVKRYEVTIHPGDDRESGGLTMGPYVAETYPVRREGTELVVLDI